MTRTIPRTCILGTAGLAGLLLAALPALAASDTSGDTSADTADTSTDTADTSTDTEVGYSLSDRTKDEGGCGFEDSAAQSALFLSSLALLALARRED